MTNPNQFGYVPVDPQVPTGVYEFDLPPVGAMDPTLSDSEDDIEQDRR